MKKMIATKKQQYENRRIAEGDVFNVRDQDIVLLKALGRVKDMPDVGAMSTQNTPALVPTPRRDEPVVERQHVAEIVHPEPQVVHQLEAEKSETVEPNVETNPVEMYKDDEESVEESEGSQVSNSIEYSKMLRDRATTLGIRVDGRWSDVRVQREIDEHNKRMYSDKSMGSTLGVK